MNNGSGGEKRCQQCSLLWSLLGWEAAISASISYTGSGCKSSPGDLENFAGVFPSDLWPEVQLLLDVPTDLNLSQVGSQFL